MCSTFLYLPFCFKALCVYQYNCLFVEDAQGLGHAGYFVVGPVGEDVLPHRLGDDLVAAEVDRGPRAGVQAEHVAVPLPLPLQGLHRGAAEEVGVADEREARIAGEKKFIVFKKYRLQYQDSQSREIMGTGNLVPGSYKPAW